MEVSRPNEPGYAGGTTFRKVPLVLDRDELQDADVVILGAPVDDFVSNRPGARFGPREIRNASDAGGTPSAPHMDVGIDLFEVLSVFDHGDAEVVPGNGLASHDAIRRGVEAILTAEAVPVILGGDHSIAYPDVTAVAAHHEQDSLAIVQFDAHADTAEELWGVKHSHGCPFRHLVDEGVIPGRALVQVGLRGYWPDPEEFEWMRSAGVRWHRMEKVIQDGIDHVIDEVLVEIADFQHLYLSVDIDVLDPAFAPGTGTPEPGGMSSRELLRAVLRLATEKNLAGMEVVEVSPPYDHSGITSMAAHRCVGEALTGLALNRTGRKPRPEDPA